MSHWQFPIGTPIEDTTVPLLLWSSVIILDPRIEIWCTSILFKSQNIGMCGKFSTFLCTKLFNLSKYTYHPCIHVWSSWEVKAFRQRFYFSYSWVNSGKASDIFISSINRYHYTWWLHQVYLKIIKFCISIHQLIVECQWLI